MSLDEAISSLRRGNFILLHDGGKRENEVDMVIAAEFEMVGETVAKTNLGYLESGDSVNIERSLKVGQRLEGHFVLGHVDGVGTISKLQKQTNQVKIWIKIPKELSKYIIKKGSVTVDGISLTIVEVLKDQFSVSIIPHTMKITNLNYKKVGDKVNIETDVLGKYILSNN